MKIPNFIEITIISVDIDDTITETKSIINTSNILDVTTYNDSTWLDLKGKVGFRVKEPYDYFKNLLLNRSLND